MYYVIHDSGNVIHIAYNVNYEGITDIDTPYQAEEITESEFEQHRNNLANLQYEKGLKVV